MKLRVAVVGVGPMGQGHVKHYKSIAGCELVAVVDTDPKRRGETAIKTGVRAFADSKDLIGRVDAVSIATPTTTHREIALPLIEAGIHVLIEKPLAPSGEAAEAIVNAARDKGVVLQVGHIERFNPAFKAANEVISDPRYVVCDRLAPFSFRSRDIGVVLDLMIHDLDILLTFLRADLTSLEAIGIPVLSTAEDMCDVRLRFADGALADVRASRVSMKRMRKIRIFQSNAYVSIDYDAKKISIFKKSEAYERGDLDPSKIDPSKLDDPFGFVFGKLLDVKEYSTASTDALRDELISFLEACRGLHTPVVPGEDGLKAVRLADRIRLEVRDYVMGEVERTGIDLPPMP